jgi:predicted AlkP superfamily pyrophosphatase or phosphodiesterase
VTGCCLLALTAFSCASSPPVDDKPNEPPKLVVLIVIDQFPAWIVPQVEKHFVPRGFRRLMNDGAWFEQAHYPQAATITGVGHATIATGGVPAGHGIVGNAWYDRAAEQEVYCVADESVAIVGGPAEKESKVSPRLLTATTFADEQRIASGFHSKSIAISAKDRSAILLAGHTGKAIWYTQKSGLFLSSTYYYPDGKLPAWAEKFNAGRPADKYLNQTWSPLLAPADYGAPPDDRPFEIDFKGLGRTFPHMLGKGLKLGPDFYKALTVSPKGNELLLDAARAAIAGERLGARDVTDILCVSLTSNDYVGHAFGPESIEYLDMTLQTDRQLERFFAELDATLGAGRWTAVLTSDHGSCASPEYLHEQGLDVGRVDPALILGAADRALDDAFGSDDWIAPYNDPGVTIRPSVLRKHKASLVAAQRIAADAVRRVPGVADVFTSAQLASGQFPPTAVSRAAAATIHLERGPDLVVIPKPYWYLSREMHQHAAMHGTPYPYDTHVPVFFYGPGISPGRHARRVQMTDVAPSVAAYLRIPAPSASDGEPLAELFRSQPAASRE